MRNVNSVLLFLVLISISCDNNQNGVTLSDKIDKAYTVPNSRDIIESNELGEFKNINGVELYFTSNISEDEVKKMCEYLLESGFADGERKTVQLDRNGNTYEFRMVVKKGIEQDDEYINLGKQMAAEISGHVLDNKQVDIHFCDEKLITLRVLPMSRY